jgi:hypothetical protein
MLHRQSLQSETRDRGPLLEQLRQLSVPMGGISWETPAGKKDVKKHQQYLNAIKGPMDALLEKVDEYYAMDKVYDFGDIKDSFHDVYKNFEKNFYWYTEKANTVEHALTIIAEIENKLRQAEESVMKYLGGANDNGIKEAVQACYPPLNAYKAYIQAFVSKK